MAENNKYNELALPSDVVKEVATKNGWEELEYRKEKGKYLDETTYERQSWIVRKGSNQKEVIKNYSELKPKVIEASPEKEVKVEEVITIDLTKETKKE